MGDSAGWTATACRPGLRGFRARAIPVKVPPVPTPATTISIWPAVSRQISSAVVASWMAGFAGFSNCWGMNEPGVAARISSATRIEPFIPSAAGLSTSSAPYCAMSARRSTDIDSGSTIITRYPIATP